MPDQNEQKFPISSPEIANTLGFNAKKTEKRSAEVAPPADLPVVDSTATAAKTEPDTQANIDGKSREERIKEDVAAITGNPIGSSPAVQGIKKVLPYLVVFGVGIFLYYYFFTGFSLQQYFKREVPKQAVQEVAQDAAYKELLVTERDSFNSWISQFYYDVSDASILAPETDNSGNGLNNFQKYLLGLNPKAYDTLGLGMSDSQAIKQGINPLTGKELTSYQREIIKKYLNLEGFEDKGTERTGNVAHAATTNSPVVSNPSPVSVPASNPKPVQMTAPAQTAKPTTSKPVSKPVVPKPIVTQQSTNTVTPTPASTPSQPIFNKFGLEVKENNQNIDFSKPGKLELPAIGVTAPIIWTRDTDTIDKDLESGVVHFPGTPLPGDIGTSYISGHSSGYAWSKGDYNNVFANLDRLPDGAKFIITATSKDGKTVKMVYRLDSRGEFKPGDQNQFINTADPKVALSTCWPIGGTAKRLVVYGKLESIEKY